MDNRLTENFDDLISKIRASGISEANQEALFKRIIRNYLDNAYSETFSTVSLRSSHPDIDLEARDLNTHQLIFIYAQLDDRDSETSVKAFINKVVQSEHVAGILVAINQVLTPDVVRDLKAKSIHVISRADLRNANLQLKPFYKRLSKMIKNNSKKSNRSSKSMTGRFYYQRKAVERSVKYYRTHSRGKLIMAPGTGKTFTSLNIAEALQKDQHESDFYVLYLVPSIQLLSQTLRSWSHDVNADTKMVKFAVASDDKAATDDISIDQIGFPATTDADELLRNYRNVHGNPNQQKRLIVIFSTYQSIDVISEAQKKGYPTFDLIVSDEAHRTAGSHRKKREKIFTKVHSNQNVKSHLRLYQTATPKVYGEKAKRKGKENSVVVYSMDNPKIFGDTIYRYTFGQAVDDHNLTDFKVIVLTLDKRYVSSDLQRFENEYNNTKIPPEDYGRILGTINAMLKRRSFSDQVYGLPMKRAIAFASVNDLTKVRRKNGIGAKQISEEANQVSAFKNKVRHGQGYKINFKAVAGNMNAQKRKAALNWLAKDKIPHNEARVLANVRFLGEGIDVPNLDAVIFFTPKQSQIDIVQTVGRVMRKYPHKKWGYIILPVIVPYNEDPSDVLENSKYDSIWEVLNALRSIDERFDAEINSLELNKNNDNTKNPPQNLSIIGQNRRSKKTLNENSYDGKKDQTHDTKVEQLHLPLKFRNFQNAIYGEIVKHVGNRHYLQDWTDDIQEITRDYMDWINRQLKRSASFKADFDQFLKSLRNNINDHISANQAVGTIAQHIITKPVFNSLFKQNDFSENPVSKAMDYIVGKMNRIGFARETKSLHSFYRSVELRAKNVKSQSPQGKQQLINRLYGDFFKKSFSKTASKLGIVFTPTQVVDFIVNSVDYALHKYFGKSIASHDVNVLDPFVGTGTFITETLFHLNKLRQRGQISADDIKYNYEHNLFCNEIVLLSYYIADVNIASVYNEMMHNSRYQGFKGIVLTDTFESTERDNVLDEGIFNGNNKRLRNEKNNDITVIMSNPPYSEKQHSQNDNAQNEKYPKLDKEIKNTYVKISQSSNTQSMYDSYVKAIRWSSDRIGQKGILGFVTNGKYINSKGADGLRKCLYDEFNYLYIYDLEGNHRGTAEFQRKQGISVFGQGTMTPVAISIMVKDGSNNHKVFYRKIGDYLSQEDKFKILKDKDSIGKLDWQVIHPDKYHDWINQRDPRYQKFISLHHKGQESIFSENAVGLQTKRDPWVYGFSKINVIRNVKELIKNYNSERIRLINRSKKYKSKFINRNPKFIKWSPNLERYLNNNEEILFHPKHIKLSFYRPFTKKWLYHDKQLNDRPSKYYTQFGKHNLVIFTSGRGANKPWSVVATNLIPDVQSLSNGQGFMRYNNEKDSNQLLKPNRNNINSRFAKKLGLSTDDTFYYIYGILSSPEYQHKYKNDLKKDLARIPIVNNVTPFVEIGHKLMSLHVNYEHVAPYKGVKIEYNGSDDNPSYYNVNKMKHDHYRGNKMKDPKYKYLKYQGHKHDDLTTIIYNKNITITNIPLKAYNYVVNGRAAIDWIVQQYRIKTDKKSGIVDNPNKFKGGKYIFDLLLRVINVSIQSVDLINKLPKMQIDVKDQKI